MERNLYRGSDPTGTIGFENARRSINKNNAKQHKRDRQERLSSATHPKSEPASKTENGDTPYALKRSQKAEIHSLEVELAQLRAQRKAKAITSIDYELGQTGLTQRLQDLKGALGHDPIRPIKQFTKHGIPRVEILPIK